MRYKYIIPVLLLISVLVAGTGCIGNGKNVNVKIIKGSEIIAINYIDNENKGPILSKDNFPDFNIIDHKLYVANTNLSMTLLSESVHGGYVINSNEVIPNGFRIYGSSELYNSSKVNNRIDNRYILIQYKVFDTNESLNESIGLTLDQYVQNGFKTKKLDNNIIKNNNITRGKIFILEGNVSNTNITNNNMNTDITNNNMNIIIILFGFDNVIGKIGIQDYKDKSLDESLKVLGILFDTVKIKTEYVKAENLNNMNFT